MSGVRDPELDARGQLLHRCCPWRARGWIRGARWTSSRSPASRERAGERLSPRRAPGPGPGQGSGLGRRLPSPRKRPRPGAPRMTEAGLAPTHEITVVDEYGNERPAHVAGESPLTLKVDDREVVTLMTLGTYPEALALGYLRNQRLVERLSDVESGGGRLGFRDGARPHLRRHRHRRPRGEARPPHGDHRLRPGHGVQLHDRHGLRLEGAPGRGAPVPRLRPPPGDRRVQRESTARRERCTAAPSARAPGSCLSSRTSGATTRRTRSRARCGWTTSAAATRSSTPPAGSPPRS